MIAHINNVIHIFDENIVKTLSEDPSDIFNFESRIDKVVFLPKSNFILDTFEEEQADNLRFVVVASKFIYPRRTEKSFHRGFEKKLRNHVAIEIVY